MNDLSSAVTNINVSLANGRRVEFKVDQSAIGPACFVFGIRKCGSSMFNVTCQLLALMNNRHLVLLAKFFNENIPEEVWSIDPAICDLLYAGNVYCGFRRMPDAFTPHPVYRDGRKILMVRDPRDALVSEFFSMAYSHPIPARTGSNSPLTDMIEWRRRRALDIGIDQFTVNAARAMRGTFLGYADLSRSANVLVLKYEDYIFRKAELIHVIVEHFGWAVQASEVELIISNVDKRPTIEDPFAFVRRVTPGDHRDKLRPETIAALNEVLKPAMELFGYQPP